ncbi:hypothetical protein COX03_03160 [Candidatus Woesebacteria bacterium CG22_combo_CG10-13_8_21_14_all_39_10]|uniref:DUF6922 domain-containing protein n=2 Tax=Candidatus Woeseibacteriota TaxID=1752722 RepID=A0A2H0BIC6_9BACT|nr:MAG: hypothetical protein COX03_03160 [Candidatus Woesebacteria bacterium CG22_combo_CG10-13_8_21_14_all_39_10]PIZ47461.1 MAG: hypothetical protein COY29_05165 [Candidatus Woesebacteria bacterium CG_4_10_14_0_2_um_filter_39_14]
MAKIPGFLQPYLASYELSNLDPQRDRKLIITEVLNKGDGKALEWLTQNYSKKDIEKVVSFPTKGMWLNTNLDYWLRIFDAKISKTDYKNAIINFSS